MPLFNNTPKKEKASSFSTDTDTGSFINAMDLDDNLDILYTNGTTHLARFSAIGFGSATRTNLTNPLLNNITAIKVSPYTTGSSKVFAGTSNGTLIKVENADTATQTVTDISGSSFLGSVSSIEFGSNENNIFVTFHNFGVTSVWYTSDGGTSWNNKEGDLPDIPVKCILGNPVNNNEIIIGTELGVWKTKNFNEASPNWTQSHDGMSNVPVTSFDLRTADDTILASTYGRGMFSGQFAPEFPNDGDIHVYGQDEKMYLSGLPAGTTTVTYYNNSNEVVLTKNIMKGNTNISIVTIPTGVYTIKFESGGVVVHEELFVKL